MALSVFLREDFHRSLDAEHRKRSSEETINDKDEQRDTLIYLTHTMKRTHIASLFLSAHVYEYSGAAI